MAGTATTRNALSPEDLAAIAAAPPTATPTALARELGLSLDAVRWHLGRFRRAGGWSCELKLPPCTECGSLSLIDRPCCKDCELKLPPCTECGEPVIGPPRRITHVACVPARKARWVREQRRRFKAADPEALEARRVRDLALATRYFHGLPEARKAELFANWRATARRDYEITLEVADRRGAPWDEDDDEYVLANLGTAAREVGLALGRTTFAVYRRRGTLRRWLETEAGKAMRRVRRGERV